MTGRAWRGTAVLVAGSLLCACAPFGLAPDPVNPDSAVADKVRAASKARPATPKFSDVPAKPADVRPAEAYRAQVREAVVARRGLERWVASNPPLTTDATEAFAAQGQAALAAAQASLPSLDEGTADTEAFAQQARDRAAPPPSSK